MKKFLTTLLHRKYLPYVCAFFATCLVCFVGIVWFVCRLPASPLDKVSIPTSDAKLISKGEYIARLSDCAACHSVSEQQTFAGGLKMVTPLGAIFSTNITPDPELGIGMYSLGDFDRAVRMGVGHDGHRLYPAMPYPSYSKLSNEDVTALYAFFRYGLKPAHVPNKKNEIPIILNIRWPLAFWNLMFVPKKPYAEVKSQDKTWNRGAYLVEGAGHCGACHTPRNSVTMSEKGLDASSKTFLAGAAVDNWYAPSLRNGINKGLGKWSEADIYHFLKEGRNAHGVVFGSMADVFNNSTQFMSDEDLYAIAHYLKFLPADPKEDKEIWTYDAQTNQDNAKGSKLYAQRCGFCHGMDGKGKSPWIAPLAGPVSSLLRENLSSIDITLNGSPRVIANSMPDAYRMPSFRRQLSNEDIADILSYIRSSWGNHSEKVTAKEVAALRKETSSASPSITVLQVK
ncbi:c-type cytochrome [Acetobacteraceae bacterium]|nr:c-type cytochrome [Acetobacteraceae bacterium]